MEFEKLKDALSFPSPCSYVPGFQQDPWHEPLVFGVWTVGHQAGKGSSNLETQGLAPPCTYMKGNRIKRNTELSAHPLLAFLQGPDTACVARGQKGTQTPRRGSLPQCSAAAGPQGNRLHQHSKRGWTWEQGPGPREQGRVPRRVSQSDPRAGPDLCCSGRATLTWQLPQDLYKIINIILTGKDIDLQISLTFTNK